MSRRSTISALATAAFLAIAFASTAASAFSPIGRLAPIGSPIGIGTLAPGLGPKMRPVSAFSVRGLGGHVVSAHSGGAHRR